MEKIQTAKEFNPLCYKAYFFADVFGRNNCSSISMIRVSELYDHVLNCLYIPTTTHTETQSRPEGWDENSTILCFVGVVHPCSPHSSSVLLYYLKISWKALTEPAEPPSEALLDGTSLSLKCPLTVLLHDEIGNDSSHNRNVNCLTNVGSKE